MFLQTLSAETLKYRRTLALTLALLAPLGLSLMHVLGYALSPQMHNDTPAEKWDYLAGNVFALWVILFLPLGTAILAALATNLEHADNHLKHILSLPPSRFAVYMAKLVAVLALVLMGSFSLMFSIIISAYLIGAGPALVWHDTFWKPLVSFAAIVPVLALGVWVGMRWRSFVVGVGMGLGGTVVGITALRSPNSDFWRYIPWSYPQISTQASNNSELALGLAAFTAILVVLWGLFDFARRDVF